MAKRAPSKKPQNVQQTDAAQVTPPERAEPTKVGDQDQVRFYCPKHGDITNATLHLSFAGPDGEKQGQYLYCLHCLNEVLLSLQKSGAIETVQIVVPDEVAEKLKEQEGSKPVDPAAAIQQMAEAKPE